MTIAEIFQLLQAGGNTALLVCVFVIWRAEKRFARVEAMLEIALLHNGVNPDDVAPKQKGFLSTREPT